MSNKDHRDSIAQVPRRPAGRRDRASEHVGRAHARSSTGLSTHIVGETEVEQTLLDVFDTTVARYGDRPAIDTPTEGSQLRRARDGCAAPG